MAKLSVKNGQEAAFEAAFNHASILIAQIDGYIAHQLHRGIDVPGPYLLLV